MNPFNKLFSLRRRVAAELPSWFKEGCPEALRGRVVPDGVVPFYESTYF